MPSVPKGGLDVHQGVLASAQSRLVRAENECASYVLAYRATCLEGRRPVVHGHATKFISERRQRYNQKLRIDGGEGTGACGMA